MIQKQRLTPLGAIPKIKAYCSYQERSHFEVLQKLYSYGIYKSDAEEIIAMLISENYLNEERYAGQYAGGKFRIKNWGRVKITQELKAKNISSYNIKTALKAINEEDYIKNLEKVAKIKWETLKKEPIRIKEAKIIRYLLQKGYEFELIKQVLANIKERT